VTVLFTGLFAQTGKVEQMQVTDRHIDPAHVHRRCGVPLDTRSKSGVSASFPADVVYLVDDDPVIREQICACLSAQGLKVVGFASAAACLNAIDWTTASCMVLNIRLPDICGLEFQRQLVPKSNPPLIFIADDCDVTAAVSAMKAGAIDLLTKPLDLPALVRSVGLACERNRKQRIRKAVLTKLQERYSLLSPREREVFPLIVGGLLNKQAASLLGIAEVTLQIHRGQVMRKMQAGSLAELVRMAVDLGVPHWRHEGHDAVADSPRETIRYTLPVL
jgi:FixJ family two-component response regulator